LQYKILCQAAKKLKKGGTVVYSTCTLSKAENEDNVEKFLAEHRDFEAVDALPEYFPGRKFVTLFPEDFGSDGFFIAKLVKK
jgi:16S rRNA (cytosine967-C5)-methyltransferase